MTTPQQDKHRIVAECWTCARYMYERDAYGASNLRVAESVDGGAVEYHRAAGHDVRPVTA